MPPLQNRRFRKMTAVVTGASSGIGRSIALALAAEGATVALVARRLHQLRRVARRCAGLGSQALCCRIDLLNEGEILSLKEQVLKGLGGVDILVHSAGVIALSSIARASLRDFDWQYQCNVRAPFAVTQAFLPSLIARKGQVVFINSTVGLQASKYVSQYAATKHALKAVADSLREEVNEAGVRVLSVYLGRTATSMQKKVHAAEGRLYEPGKLIQPGQVAAAVLNALAISRKEEITDIRIRPAQKPGPTDRQLAK